MLIFGVFVIMTNGFAQTRIFNAGSTMSSAVTTWVLSDFDDHALIPDLNIYNGGRHDVTWNAVGSRYITKTDEKPYPQKGYLEGFPTILPYEFKQRPENSLKIFVVKAAFNSIDFNYLDLLPVDANNTVYVDEVGKPLPGIFFTQEIHQFGLYTLGIKRDYYLSIVFSTEDGDVFSVPMGSLNFTGWKAFVVDIPLEKHIDEQTYINNSYLVRMDKLRIETASYERVDDFIIYLDQIFYTLTSVQEDYYDGFDLLRSDSKNNPKGKTSIDWVEGNITQ